MDPVWLIPAVLAPGAVMAARSLWRAHRRVTAALAPERDALTDLADLEQHFRSYANRINHLYPREENPQP